MKVGVNQRCEGETVAYVYVAIAQIIGEKENNLWGGLALAIRRQT